MKVSCVMVTGHRPERRCLAEVAINCFLRQTYRDRELVIVNEGPPFGIGVEVMAPAGKTLGELRNMGLAAATGGLILQWDDDDWYGPLRIETQVQAQTGKSAVILENEILCDLKTGEASAVCTAKWRRGGFPGTILHPQSAARYPSLAKSEDDVFMNSFPITVLRNPPSLYIRNWTGHNTWDKQHYDWILKGDRRDLNQRERDVVDGAIAQYRAAGYR